MRLVIVGGVAAGASVAARFRRLNEEAEIIMLEKGPHVSFSNCGLPYHISGIIENEQDLVLMDPSKFLNQYNIIAKTHSEVIEIKNSDKKVVVKDHILNNEYELDYDKLVLAPGSISLTPPFVGMDLVNIYPLKTVPDVSNIVKQIKSGVKKAVVIGGGFIGVEAAENLVKLGIDTTLVEGADQLMNPFDPEMAALLHNEMTKNGVKLVLNQFVDHFERNLVSLSNGDKIEADLVIMSIGIRPNTEFIKSSGIKLNEHGYIIVDETYKTSDNNIYAAGDAILVKNQITGNMQSLALAGPANKQGRLVADAIFGRSFKNKGYIGSSVIKVFNLNAASTGISEKMAISNNLQYLVAYASPVDKVSIMPNAHPITFKLIFNKDNGIILGAQAIGRGNVDKRIDVIATAIKAEMDVYDLADLELTYAPPFSTGKDVVNKMGYISQSLLEQQHQQVCFTEVYNLIKQKAQIIDVREEHEFNSKHLMGVNNIPMSQIRSRLDEIDINQPVYIHCKSGQRSYNVTLLLQQKGFNAYNIAGGFELIKSYEQAQLLIDGQRHNIFE